MGNGVELAHLLDGPPRQLGMAGGDVLGQEDAELGGVGGLEGAVVAQGHWQFQVAKNAGV